MKCGNCGSELTFRDNIGVCISCGSEFSVDSAFENNEVCICYIEKDENGRRTKDSIIAAEVYKSLESKKINTFYEHISASEITGDDLEVIRYAAIVNSKIIVIVGTNGNNFSKLFKKFANAFADKRIIPVISDMKPEELPEKLRTFQASNFDSLGALNDLSTSILNMLGRGQEVELKEVYNKQRQKKKIIITIAISVCAALLCATIILAIMLFGDKEDVSLTNEDIYNNAIQMINEGKYLEAVGEFNKILDYKDSSNQVKKLYNRFDGYYEDKERACALHLNIIDGKMAEFSFEKTVKDKTILVEKSLIIENNVIKGVYVDNLFNEGDIAISLNNDKICLNVKSKSTNSDITFGDISTEFLLENKSDRPNEKKVTGEVLLKWITNPTNLDDIKTAGYKVENIHVPNADLGFFSSFGNRFKISNTDIILVTTRNYNSSNANGDYLTFDFSCGKEIIIAAIVPASIICPEKIGEVSCAYTKDEVIYVPNATDFYETYDIITEDCFFTFSIGDQSTTLGEIEPLNINKESLIGITSKNVIGAYEYEKIIKENSRIYNSLLTLQQHKNKELNANEDNCKTIVKLLAEKKSSMLICVHERELRNSAEVSGTNEFYSYYKMNSSTKKCELIAQHKFITADAGFGLLVDRFDDWENYPEIFAEFINK